MSFPIFKRCIWIVMDGVGAGAAPDAPRFHDVGADTLGNCSRAFQQKTGRTLLLPHLQKLGIGNLTPMAGIAPLINGQGSGIYGRAAELSEGKDTTSGHWEMAGVPVKCAFATYPNGFPKEIVERWCAENKLPGVLHNHVASGTEIIDQFGVEHLESGKPILYTSADSVWQIAAHEETFGLKRLYEISLSARKLCDELGISRVIARPFVGDPRQGKPFSRTYNRKDYAQLPPEMTLLDHLVEEGVNTIGVGKISSIFAHQGILRNEDTKGNEDGFKVLLDETRKEKSGLIYCNLIDFDMLFGHRRDPVGFGNALETFDQFIPSLLDEMTDDDLMMITADHGNDPTYRGTDHTREFAPMLIHSPRFRNQGSRSVGDRTTFGDMGVTLTHALLGHEPKYKNIVGRSFLQDLNP